MNATAKPGPSRRAGDPAAQLCGRIEVEHSEMARRNILVYQEE